jgi:hypothetical protein
VPIEFCGGRCDGCSVLFLGFCSRWQRSCSIPGGGWAPGAACKGGAAVGEGGRGAGLGCRVADAQELLLAVLAARYRRRRTRWLRFSWWCARHKGGAGWEEEQDHRRWHAATQGDADDVASRGTRAGRRWACREG